MQEWHKGYYLRLGTVKEDKASLKNYNFRNLDSIIIVRRYKERRKHHRSKPYKDPGQ